MKNYDTLFDRCTKWLKKGGKMFIHIFVHKTTPCHLEAESEDDWMSKYFFTGGTCERQAFLLLHQGSVLRTSGA